MPDIRWFAPNRFCTLPVAALRDAGVDISGDGDAPARLAVASDGSVARPAFAFAHRHRCPLLLYLWDFPPWYLPDGRGDFVFAVAGRLVKIPRVFGRHPERRGYYSRIRFIARHAAAVWCPSHDAQQALQRRIGVAVDVVPFCYDSERFHPAVGRPRPITSTRPVLLSVSRLVAYKNHAAVLRAAARIAPRPLVHIIGRGPEAMPLHALAGELGVDLRLDDGWQSDAAMVAAYCHARVVVCPSRFEGFGLTPMEGIAMGIPVVASDIPPHREFVGGHARFFALDDDDALVKQIEAALATEAPTVLAPEDSPLPELTIGACVGRFLPRLQELLHGEGVSGRLIARRGFEPR